MAGYLLSKGIDALIMDEQLDRVTEERLAEIIKEHEIKVIGISVLTLTSSRAYEISQMIRRNWPDVTIIMGGIHVTLLPEEPLYDDLADVVVRGEGEITCHELLERIFRQESYYDIKGISFKRDGRIIHNLPRELIANLDELPPFPFHLFEENQDRYQFGNMLTSRGCPYDCIFCSQKVIGGKRYRTRSPENIVKEIELLVNHYHQDFIFFNNDNFIINRKHCYKLCELIIARKFPDNLKLGINARADVVDLQLLKRLKQAHVFIIIFGLETGSERIMKMIKKGETVAKCAEAVRLAKEAGLLVSGPYILGFPTETREESLQTIRTAFNLPVDFTRFNLLVPYPGTEVYKMIYKSRPSTRIDWSNFASHSGLTGQGIPYVPEGRTAKELLWLQWKANFLFYLRPKQIRQIRLLYYGMANQIAVPDPSSLKGAFELFKFLASLVVYAVKRILAKSLLASAASKDLFCKKEKI